MNEIIKLLEDLSEHDLDDDGDIVLYDGVTWHERILEALNLVKKHKILLVELTEGMDPYYYEEVLAQVGLE